MPAKSEKQKRFFGAVEGAKHGQKNVSGKAKKVAKEISDKDAKKFLHTADEDEEKSYQKSDPKQRIKGGLGTKEKMKKDDKSKPVNLGELRMKKKMKEDLKENADIEAFIECLLVKNYASANKYLNNAVESKLLNRIEEELDKPLFQ